MQITIKNLNKNYKNKMAVKDINLTLERGVYGLLGANGAGKSTLMRMLCGILDQTTGEIKFNGLDVSDEKYREVLGYLPQDFGYYPEFSGYDFLMYMSSLKGLTKKNAKRKIDELLEIVGLKEVANKKIKTYSGGMKQRLGIAQSILNDPKILILDEPTVGLDPKERVKFRNLISKLGKDRIVLLSTHIVSDVENIANIILVMKDGKVIHNGTLEDIIKTIENKVFECIVDEKEAQNIMNNYPIINIRQEKNNILLRFVSDELPNFEATPVSATLEDLYLYYFSEER